MKYTVALCQYQYALSYRGAGMASMPEGMDMAVRLMTPGELASVRAESAYAYDGRSDRPEVLPQDCNLLLEPVNRDCGRTLLHLSTQPQDAAGCVPRSS